MALPLIARRPRMRRVLRWLVPVWLPAALVALWWFASAGSTSVYFPPLRRILQTVGTDVAHGPLPADLAYSLRNLALGLLAGSALGTLLGILIGSRDRLRRMLEPILHFGRSLPQIVLVPLIIGTLGIGALPKVYAIALACLWPVLLNSIDGVRGLEPALLEMARAYRISPRRRISRLVLPGAAPQIVAGIRVALAVGLVVMVFSELYGATSGLGYYILTAGATFNMRQAWGGTLLVAALGYLLSTVMIVAERRLLRWYFASAGAGGRDA